MHAMCDISSSILTFFCNISLFGNLKRSWILKFNSECLTRFFNLETRGSVIITVKIMRYHTSACDKRDGKMRKFLGNAWRVPAKLQRSHNVDKCGLWKSVDELCGAANDSIDSHPRIALSLTRMLVNSLINAVVLYRQWTENDSTRDSETRKRPKNANEVQHRES